MNPLNLGKSIDAVFLKAVFYWSLDTCMVVGLFFSSSPGGFIVVGFYGIGGTYGDTYGF